MIAISDILDYFKEDVKTFKRGEDKFKADRVLSFEIHDLVISSYVQAKMKDKSYKVNIFLKEEGGINDCTCECPRGQWVCSHMAAVLIYAERKGLSKTNLPTSWIRHPKRHRQYCSYSELFPEPRPSYRAIGANVSDEHFTTLSDSLLSMNHKCGTLWMLTCENDDLETTQYEYQSYFDVIDVQQIVNLSDVEFKKAVLMNESAIRKLEELTRGQSNNALWSKARKLRITASNFGRVIDACCRGKYPPSLFKTLCGQYNLDKKDSISWGRIHERSAVQKYIDSSGNRVTECGLFLFPNGIMGGSPDGVVSDNCDIDDDGLLEVKCPFKYRDYLIKDIIELEKINNSLKTFYLTEDLKINPKHHYYSQIQGCLHAANRDWCDFVVWTTKDVLIIRVLRDFEWATCHLSVIEQFYYYQFLPYCREL